MDNNRNANDFTMNIPRNAQKVMNTLELAGFTAHVVGGPVRDAAMGIDPHDWDITTSAHPQETLSVFEGWNTRYTDNSIRHGTVVVRVDGEDFEVTTHRLDVSCDGRNATVAFGASLEDDLARRDITINAMAFNYSDGLIDLFGGVEDIENGIIRAVGNAQNRVREDYSRMLRAIRFALRFGFSIEENTLQAIRDNAPLILNTPREVIFSEFEQIILAGDFHRVESVFRHVASCFLPAMEFVDFRILERATQNLVVRMAIILRNHTNSRDVLRSFGCDNSTAGRVESILGHCNEGMFSRVDVSRAIAQRGFQSVDDVIDFQVSMGWDVHSAVGWFARIVSSGECVSLAQLAVNGNDFVEMGMQGREIGRALDFALDSVITGNISNDRESILSLFDDWRE